MIRIFIILITFCCVLGTKAQIKAQREYDYVGTEVNNAGLRVVGIKKYDTNRYENFGYGCIDKDGNEAIPLIYKEISLDKEWNYIVVTTYGGIRKWDGQQWVGPKECQGILSEDGKRTIVPIEYKSAHISADTYFKYKCTIVKTHNDHFGIVNILGDKVVPVIYESLDWIDKDNGFLAAKLNGLWGIIDYHGKEIVPYQYKEMGAYNGFALVEKESMKRALIDSKGNIIIDSDLSGYLCHFNGWTVWAMKDNKYALLDTKGNIIIPYKNYGKNANIPYYDYSSQIRSNSYYDVKMICYEYKNRKRNYTVYFDDLGLQHNTYEEAEKANIIIRKKDDDNNNSLAKLIWKNTIGETKQQYYELSISVKSDSKIENVSISINGVLDRGIKTVESDDYDMTINKTISLSEGENVITVSVANATGTTQEEKTIVYRPQGGELPTIEWLDFVATANKKEYQMKLGIKSKTKVEEVNVTLNGTQSRGIKIIQTDGYDLMVDRTLSLSEGVNRIVVSVRNEDGITTSEKVITYQGVNPTPIFNDKRIAFVVGNSHYSNSEMNLVNPENDAKDVAEKLKSLGFEVVLKVDATKENMEKELSAFGEKAKDYDVALFYYAGHGIQSKGLNYIIPTNIEDLSENNLKWKCINVEQVLDVMEDSQCKLKIVVLDACRNDPVSRRWHRSTGTRGLSIMSSPIGTIIAYSTAPGMTAQDGTERNSPYTEAFLNTLDMPNLDISNFFQEVMARVTNKTHQAQNPWWSSSYTGKFYFNKQ